jgi:glycosyltransferase involved in cell wall biosynthesis
MTGAVHVVMPAGVRDRRRPSGGNAYDLRVCAGLVARGWSMQEHLVPGSWPHPDEEARAGLARVLASVPAGELVIVDGLLASAAPETLVSQRDRLRCAVLVHMPLGHALPEPVVIEQEGRALSAADIVVATSKWTRSWVLDAYRLRPTSVHVAVPGADRAPVAPKSATGHRLLAVGPVSHAKGHDTLMGALDRLRHLDWRLDCAGSLRVDPRTAGRVADWAGTTARVDLRGALDADDLEAAYAGADLLVHPSRAETYGMVVTEALARGVPVVASDVGGTREALGATEGHGVPGLLVRPGDVDELTAALTAWLTDEDRRRRLRDAALARREQLPTWDATVAALEAALRTTVLSGAGR